MKLSIIIPVYKVEAHLDYCLRSVCRQEPEDCEIILVDDCSPDRCGTLCDEWAGKDARIRVIHHTRNRGLSMARNSGIDMAQGEYITFIDSDDYLAPGTLAANVRLLDAHKEADVAEYPVCVYHGTPESYRYRPGHDEVITFIDWIKRKGYKHSYAWNKIYRRELWQDMHFPEGKLFEDMYTIPYILQKARGILCSSRGMYFYCSHHDTISKTVSQTGVKDLLDATLHLYDTLVGSPELTKTEKDELYLTLCNQQIVYLQHGGGHCIPQRRIPFRRALFTRRPTHARIKAVIKSLCGERYCNTVARARKLLRK